METRKKIFGAECLFTALIAVYEVVTVLALFTDLFSGITIKQNILFSQSLIFVPTVLYLFIMRKHVKDIIWFRRFHPLTLLLIPPLVLFMEPLITLLNAISMLFVRNEISHAASALVDHNTLGTSLFFMAFLPCVIEELAYRGVMFGSFHEAGRLKAILMSGFLFGLMHMNFNQAGYAMVLGLGLALALEATDSLWGSMIIHFVFNASSSLELFLISRMAPEVYETMQDAEISGMELQMSIGVYLMLACITTALAGCVLAWISKNEGRQTQMRAIWNNRKQPGEKVVTIPLIIGVVLALAYMVIEVVLQ